VEKFYPEDLAPEDVAAVNVEDEDDNTHHNQLEFSTSFISVGNRGSCTGRGRRQCDARKPDCEWFDSIDGVGYCADNDSATQCIELGNDAAGMIAFKHCRPNGVSITGFKTYPTTCRDVGIGQCTGQIFDQVKKLCGAPNTSTTIQLQNRCSREVNMRIEDNTGEKFLSEE